MTVLLHNQSRELYKCLIKSQDVERRLNLVKRHHIETYHHSKRVGLLSIDVGYDFDLDINDLRRLGYSGLYHDIGKIKIPEAILSKNSALTKTEREIINGHARQGFVLLKYLEDDMVTKIIIAHHEYESYCYPRNGLERRKNERIGERRRYDGNIDTLAQIVAISDLYDALLHKRSYKPSFKDEEIEQILNNQFTGDPIYIEKILERHSS